MRHGTRQLCGERARHGAWRPAAGLVLRRRLAGFYSGVDNRRALELADHLAAQSWMQELTHEALADALNRSGLLNNSAKGTWKPWTFSALRKPRQLAMEELERRRRQREAEVTIIIEDPTGPAPPADPVRRRLTLEEIRRLDEIMSARGMRKSQVMDELGFDRRDCSLWMARSCGTAIKPELVAAFERWLDANRGIRS